MKKTTMGLAVLLASISSAAVAQQHEPEETRADLNVAWALPQGELGDSLDVAGMGLTVLFGGRVPGSPFVLGTELGFFNYGTDERLELHSLRIDRDGITTDLPLEVVHVGTSHNILTGHMVGRIQLPEGPLQPYLDALLGVKYFLTQTRLESDVVLSDEGLFAVSHFKDWAFSYGAGAGLALRLFTGPMGIDKRPATVSLNVGVRYLLGGEAAYLREGSIRQEAERFIVDVRRSRTDLLVSQFGFCVNL